MARGRLRQRREAARALRIADAAFPGAFRSWQGGLRALRASRAGMVAVAVVLLVELAAFAPGYAGDHRAVLIAVRTLAWVTVTIAVLRGPVLGGRQLLATVAAATAIVAMTTLPGRWGITGALAGAFLGCLPGLLWRGVSLGIAGREGFLLLVRRLAGAVGVFIVGVLVPTALVVSIVAWDRSGGGDPDLTHVGPLASTMVSMLMAVTIGPMYAAMADFLASDAGTPATPRSIQGTAVSR
jgi:hypothetical protein